MNKRGVYFFVIDAFLGGAIVLLSLIIILQSYSTGAEQESPMILLEDFLSYMQNTQVRDFEGTVTQQMIDDGNITDTSNTLFEQVADFHRQGETLQLESFLDEIATAAMPEQMSIEYRFNNTKVYERTNFPREGAGLSLSSKKVSMLTINSTQVYGPHLVEVMIWTS